jgi:3'-phosphoadenosine 5'-phosphosulfate sulfotransferase (PAPS reductase)/FAD synthetase
MTQAIIYKHDEHIDVLNLLSVTANETNQLAEVVDLFHFGVAELRTIIESSNCILHCPVSQGKDSTIVELMAIEAYKQSIQTGQVESSRPLILATVDTGGEAIPMKMYVAYAKKRIISYAQSLGINIIYDIVRPPINDEYFVKYVGGQKLIPNSTRHGDCSIILKVDPSERYVKNQVRTYATQSGQNFNVVTCVGSRNNESNRRARNMTKQGIASKSGDDLLNDMQVEQIGKMKLYKFAPIKDWATDQVFDALRIAGSKPLMKFTHPQGLSIPGFLPDFGLLLEIYGNGSAETCEISVGSTASSGCNGKARFGCVYCTMVAVKDHSSTALASMERWRVLGADNALRVRDYLFRLSTDMDARALHARAFDPVGFNRVALQPNTLQPRHLEKMVRYASQLSIDSIQAAADFKLLVEQGREMEHSGYRDIANDMSIPPKTKKSFLEMYKECAQEPQNLNDLFSFKHALLLSFRWSIDGIGSAPYRPLAIWKQIEKGEGRIPYPLLNSELAERNVEVSLQPSKKLPEAVMMPILKNEDPTQYAMSPVSLLDLWTRPLDGSDIYDEERNCSIVRSASNTVDVAVHYNQGYSVNHISFEQFDPATSVSLKDGENTLLFRIKPTSPVISKAVVDGKIISDKALSLIENSGVTQAIADVFYEKLANFCVHFSSLPKVGDAADQMNEMKSRLSTVFPSECILKRELKHFKKEMVFTGYNENGRKLVVNHKFTRRVVKKVSGKLVKGNTRMTFYPIVMDSSAHLAKKQEVCILTPDFNTHTHKFIGTHNAAHLMSSDSDVVENLLVDDQAIEQWLLIDGLEKAMEQHDMHFKRIYRMRHQRGASKFKSIRQYGGTHVAEQLLADGVISCESAYWSQLQAILKRTHIFNELGLFSFQSMKAEDVELHPRAISMAQHRQDKVKVLLVIREHRNAQRRAMKNARQKDSVTCEQSFAQFEAITMNAIHAMTMDLNSSIFKLRFDTADVEPATKAKVYDLWLALNYDGLTHIDKITSKLMTMSQFKQLKENSVDYMQYGQSVLAMLKRIGTQVDHSINEWSPLLCCMKSIVSKHEAGEDICLSTIKRQIVALSPIGDDGAGVLKYWNPSVKSAVSYVQKTLTVASEYSATLQKLSADIAKLQQSNLHQLTSKMTLSDKLAILKKRAA